MKKPLIDFNILPNDDPRFIIIQDASMWYHLENKPAIIEITTPGSSKPNVIVNFPKGKVSIFNSKNTLLECNESSCEDYWYLDDGFYEITLKASPDDFRRCKTYIHTANTRLKLDEAYAKHFTLCAAPNKGKLEKLKEIDFLLRAAEANTRLNLIPDAQSLFFRAQEMVDSSCKNVCK